MSNEARETLEDKVYDLYPELDMGDIQRMSDVQLMELINLKTTFRNDQPKPVKQPKPDKPKYKKISAAHEVRNGELVIVETWRIDDAFGTTSRERVTVCGTRTMYEGRLIASSILKHYLLTGEWIKRIPKPAKHRAIVRVGRKVIHLGYFATLEQKESAIFAFKLGIVPQV
jgi:hypothetical protein